MLTSAESWPGRAYIGTRLAAALLVVGLTAVVLALLVTGPLAPVLSRDLDAPGNSFFLAQAPAGASVSLLRSVGALGDPVVAGCIVLVFCTIVGVRARTWAPLFAGAAALLGAIVITSVVRQATSRSGGYGPIDGFPSGHTMAAASVFGTLAFLAAGSELRRSLKRLVVVLCVALPVAVAWSRLALLDHVPSDVIGGVVLGTAWAAAVVRAIRGPRDRHGETRTARP
jgi:membrane-associated phospholipid phosphatase